jgi:hypothetical protein
MFIYYDRASLRQGAWDHDSEKNIDCIYKWPNERYPRVVES